MVLLAVQVCNTVAISCPWIQDNVNLLTTGCQYSYEAISLFWWKAYVTFRAALIQIDNHLDQPVETLYLDLLDSVAPARQIKKGAAPFTISWAPLVSNIQNNNHCYTGIYIVVFSKTISDQISILLELTWITLLKTVWEMRPMEGSKLYLIFRSY